jgi:YihY family inner membrane protein
MSTANRVPETWELTGDDARRTLQRCGTRRLARDAFQRLRAADGFSHARSLAFTIALVLLQGIIALVGLASLLGAQGLGRGIARTLDAAVPGPAGHVLTDAVRQARHAGGSGQYLGLAFGLAGAIITGATMMGQMERALNRLYGVEQDRPSIQKYGRATLLALTAGLLATLAFAAVALGRGINDAVESDTGRAVWSVVRWPLAIGLVMAAMALLFRWAPRRRQPAWSWLAYGASTGVVLWVLATIALGLFFQEGSSFGRTYGPLAGLVALLLWALLSSVAVLFGAALGAQLEAVRAQAAEPQDPEKVRESEPEQEDDRPFAGATT